MTQDKPQQQEYPAKTKVTGGYITKDIYEYYSKIHKNDTPKHRITGKDYAKIISDWNNALINYLFTNERNLFIFPYNVGYVSLIKRKVNFSKGTKGLRVDFGETRKEGKTMYYTDTDTNNEYFYLKWSKGRIKNIYVYKFVLAQKIKRKLAVLIKNKVIV